MRFASTRLFSAVVAFVAVLVAVVLRQRPGHRDALRGFAYPSLEAHDYLPPETEIGSRDTP